ncbi:DUF805 domain-containing protein [Pseudonocardia abyssalis]|uniref:DUF805 domain-containing protein n=1 Tax=Pseudonocardia abyssalis TaxID=2792008 RepID=A0ABS6UX21_9PSEU|nr:DUF805 domain-containing protein [Pseudonocardia abyssalis]MBW0118174.1 DUF805 domain-containing protein [Pseudonocardia abyssalis]MBW0136244.1 DUF805 domain-containing protein [Pseudonocardia abyssalis]
MNWYVKVIKQYVDFSGRARRTEYWMFALFNAIAVIVLSAIDGFVLGSGAFAASAGAGSAGLSFNLGILGTIYSLAVLLPGLGVAVRRLHDTNRSGWWLLIGLIPVIGAIVLIVFLVSEGTRGPNSHGADPKQASAGAYA